MAGVDWPLVVLIVYPLVQIPLVLYLARWFEIDAESLPVTPTMAYWTGKEADSEHSYATTNPPGRCRWCGADNDPAYTFCGVCVSRL